MRRWRLASKPISTAVAGCDPRRGSAPRRPRKSRRRNCGATADVDCSQGNAPERAAADGRLAAAPRTRAGTPEADLFFSRDDVVVPQVSMGTGGGSSSWWARAHPMRAPALRFGFALWLCALALRFGFALWLCALALRFGSALLRAGARALQRGPWGAAGGGRSARRVGRRDAAKVFDRPGMACPKTPTDSREPFAHGCAKGADEGWPFFGLPFFGHAKKGRSGRPKDGPKALALRFQQRCDEASKQHRGERGAHGGPRPTL